jgi:hypothetical protein
LVVLGLSFESTPIPLGTTTSNQAGRYSARITVPLGAEPGAHHVVVTGPGPDGVARRSVGAIEVLDVDCDDVTAAEAGALLAANPSDPHRLDGDGNGRACQEDHGALPRTGPIGRIDLLLLAAAIAFIVGGQLLHRSARRAARRS